MIALDTNVVVRLIMRDDERQLIVARDVVGEGATFISTICLLEVAWVLGAIYGLDNQRIRTALLKLDEIGVVIELRDWAIWALNRAADGADFADMLLLVAARETEAFATFDRRLARRAGDDRPVSVRALT